MGTIIFDYLYLFNILNLTFCIYFNLSKGRHAFILFILLLLYGFQNISQ